LWDLSHSSWGTFICKTENPEEGSDRFSEGMKYGAAALRWKIEVMQNLYDSFCYSSERLTPIQRPYQIDDSLRLWYIEVENVMSVFIQNRLLERRYCAT
jgi:hypothetical protein